MSFLDTEHSLPALWKRIKALIHLHTDRTDNPHGVTKAQVGLGNVDNTADKDKAVASATKATQDGDGNVIADTYLKKTDAESGYTNTSVKGAAETTYRTGEVNITPENLGITVVNNTKDSVKKVAEATKATQDGAGNVITDTYLKKTDSTGFTNTKVKGAAETEYHTGNVNLTPANLGITVVNNTKDSVKKVAEATKATTDAKGNDISSTYLPKTDASNTYLTKTDAANTYLTKTNAAGSYTKTAVKGNAESSYRTGNVNITPANIGITVVNNTADKDKSVKYATSAGSAKDSSKLPLAGGTMNNGAQISRAGNSVSWVGGRSGAMVRQTSYTGYNPIASVKTTNGSWEVGPYANDLLHLSYITDANYNKGTNTQTVDIYVGPDGKIHGKITNADVASTAKDTQKVHSQTMTLSASAWSSNAQTLAPTYVTASNTVIVKPPYGYEDAYNSAEIKAVSQGAKSLKFTCSTKPTADINVVILTIT